MRIQTIEITDYKAFLDTHEINVGGKEYHPPKKRADVKAAIKAFNEAFGELFQQESPGSNMHEDSWNRKVDRKQWSSMRKIAWTEQKFTSFSTTRICWQRHNIIFSNVTI